MPTQTLIVVAIPAGITAVGDRARVSLVLSPHLRDGRRLRDFPDFEDWTWRLKSDGAHITLDAGLGAVDAPFDTEVLQPRLWPEIFPPDVPVGSYEYPGYDQRLILSYPISAAEAALKNTYQRVGASAQNTLPQNESLQQSVGPFGLGLHRAKLHDIVTRERMVTWGEQQHRKGLGRPRRLTDVPLLQMPDPDASRVEPFDSAAVTAASRRFAAFHSMPQPRDPPPLPHTEAELAEVLDFHAALTALHAYPSLMRKLGLVIDVEIPLDAVPLSPVGSAHRTIVVASFDPGAGWEIEPARRFPYTSYVRREAAEATDTSAARPAQFGAAPETVVAAGSGPQICGDIVDGLIPFTPDTFRVTRVDVDGAMHKMLALADNLENAQGQGRGGLPSLRSGGFSIVMSERAAWLQAAVEENKKLYDSLDTGTPMPRPLRALDLLRGFRVDVWSSRTSSWHSLHRRDAVYRVGAEDPIVVDVDDEEGFVQPAVTSPAPDRAPPPAPTPPTPPASTDLYASERLARWQGWSLSAPRPGKALNRSSDPDLVTDVDPTTEVPATPFKLATQFKPTRKSLPSLRFGTRYRVRLRAVDLAGNSIPRAEADLLEGNGFESRDIRYLRFEPVAAPDLVLREVPLAPGATLTRLIIRSWNDSPSLDGSPTSETTDRHVAPPRTSQHMAEQHSMLDDPVGHLRGDAATYAMLAARDAAILPTVDSGDSAHTKVPFEAGPSLAVPYIPDPLARGAALTGLPGLPLASIARAPVTGSLQVALRPQPDSAPDTVLHVEAAGAWPESRSFRLALGEGNATPVWDPATRELRAFLPKGTTVRVQLSSYVNDDDLELMAVWQWLLEYFAAEQQDLLTRSDAWLADALTDLAHRRSHVTRLAREGRHWMLTPSHELELVHAVQQPLGRPEATSIDVEWTALAGVHTLPLSRDAGAPFSPLVAWREPGSLDAYLLGGLSVHGASTAKVDFEASWTDVLDDTTRPIPGTREMSMPVDEVPLPDPSMDGDLFAPGSGTASRHVGRYLREADIIWFARSGERFARQVQFSLAAPKHRLPDTKHRNVRYRAVATTRFRECFPDDASLSFTRASEEILVSVPSSVRPLAPRVTHILPTFGWEREVTTNVQTSVRLGKGLRVYLERPWFSSGEGELLAAVLLHAGGRPSDERREQIAPYVTQWGLDPIWSAYTLGPLPNTSHFPDATAFGRELSLAETAALSVDAAGHAVRFDAERGLWYCDLTIDSSAAYAPFVRLALARYQPRSIPGAELSRVVLADFAQLAPDRSAVVTRDTAHPLHLQLVVAGPGPDGPRRSLVRVTVQRKRADVLTDLGWEPAPEAVAKVIENASVVAAPGATRWAGVIELAREPAPGELRIVVREFELIERDASSVVEFATLLRRREPPLTERLIYADFIPIAPAIESQPSLEGEPVTPDGEPDVGAIDPDRLPPLDPVEPDDAVPPWEPMPDPALPAALDPAQLPALSVPVGPQVADGFAKLAQALLNAAGALPDSGAPLSVDGLFGPQTRSAVRNFQAIRPLDATGVVDAPTWFMLLPFAPLAMLERGIGATPMRGPPIAFLQQLLNRTGADLDVNGVFDGDTADAVSDYRSTQGLPPVGAADAATWATLFDTTREAQPTGTVRFTFEYDSDWWEAGLAPLRHVMTSASEEQPAPSDGLAPAEEIAGFRLEWLDASGRTIYRKFMANPIDILVERQTGDPDDPATLEAPSHAAGTFDVVMPTFANAQTLAVFSSPLDPQRLDEAASLITSFDLSEL
jgi:peptidoglycan hydrolase-like protein with peptidoglycan-binding domain